MSVIKSFFLIAAGVGLLMAGRAPAASAQAQDLPVRQLENARVNLRDKRYADGVRGLQQVIDENPSTSVAADALLDLATYHFGTSHDLAAAQTAAEALTTTYRQFPNPAARGWVIKGRILLAQTRQPQQMTTALSNFDSVSTIYPRSEPVPMAGYYAGETLRLTGRSKAAVERLRSVISDYPTSPWTARSLIATALCDVADGQAAAAMEALQRVRLHFAGSDEARIALELNTQLYRLYVRPAAQQPAYEFSERVIPAGPSARLEDVNALVVDPAGGVFAAAGSRVLSFDANGAARPAPAAASPRGLFVDTDGVLVALQKGALARGGAVLGLKIPKPDGTPRILEDVSAAAVWSTGEYVVADPSGLWKFSRDGSPLGPLASLRAERITVNALDEVAALDREDSIVLFNRDGKSVRTLAKKGTGYELKQPVDLAFDPLGHLLVLDRGQSSVLVFSAGGKLLTTYTIPEKAAGAFKKGVALSVDRAGRLYIYDDSAKHILIHQ
jgi:outer membrane protein assembly factor BamD (BamD/ComL family)